MSYSSRVPSKLVDKNTGIVYWENQRPSPIRFCRPIRILYEKETDNLCRQEEAHIKEQIDMLQDISVEAGCTVSFQMILTTIDGKIVKQIIFIPFIKIDGYVISRFIRNLIGHQRCHCLHQSHIFINNKNCHKIIIKTLLLKDEVFAHDTAID